MIHQHVRLPLIITWSEPSHITSHIYILKTHIFQFRYKKHLNALQEHQD